jgi:O-antigen/teichoic acid export membrane protein
LVDLIVSTALQAALLFLLVPNYGPLGAAFSVGAAYLVANLMQVAQAFMLSRTNPYDRNVTRVAFACCASLTSGALALWLTLDFGYAPSHAAAALTFGGVLFALALRAGGPVRATT